MKSVIIALVISAFFFKSNAQPLFVKQWDKRFGGTKDEGLARFELTRDGGYILGGYSYSNISGDKTQNNWDTTFSTSDFWVIKIDAQANKQWDARFGGYGLDGLNAIQQTGDGGYIVGGMSYSDLGGDRSQPTYGGNDYWIVKIDSAGNKQWDKRFGGSDDDALGSIIQTNDRGYLLGGYSYSDISGDKTQPLELAGGLDYWIVKIDSLGNKQWDKDLGLGGIASMLQLADGGYLIGGSSSSAADSNSYKSGPTYGDFDYWIVKVDSIGNKQWDKDFGGTALDELSVLLATKDAGILLAGYSWSDSTGNKTTHNCDNNQNGNDDYWIVKVDTGGKKQWERDYGALGYGQLYSAAQTIDGGYLIAGNSTATDSSCAKTENNLGSSQTWIVKTDSLGLKQWDKTIFTPGVYDGYAIETADGCYAVASTTPGGTGGYITQANWDTSGNTSDFWVIKFCMYPTAINEISPKVQFNVYPNPFSNELDITLAQQNLKQADFSICNLLGQTVYTQHETNLSPAYTKMLDLSNLPNGVYWVEVVVDGEVSVREVVKQ